MFFLISLSAALILFGLGLVYKVWTWFRLQIGPDTAALRTSERLGAALKGVLRTVFSPKLLSLLKVFFLDVVLQLHILKEDFTRWFMHMCLYGGFTLLLLMHALDRFVVLPLFPDYASTLNPFLFLRNLFGGLVLLGVGIALYRRLKIKGLRLTSRRPDRFALLLLAVIMLSGFFLEAAKIVSYVRFDQMVADYADTDDPEEIRTLKAYWAREFEVVFPEPVPTDNPAALEQGRGLHEMSCAACHSRPGSAFISAGLVRLIKPAAAALTEARLEVILWYIHFLACFLGLAYLPFSKFFHLLTSPLSLLVNGVSRPEEMALANRATRRALDLDACTHCGTCSLRCSVGVVFRQRPNFNILPSEKLMGLKGLTKAGGLNPAQLRALQEGTFICTNCYRCTKVCPAGLNLQDLWFALQDDLTARGYPETFVSVRKAVLDEFQPRITDRETILSPAGPTLTAGLKLSTRAETFAHCFTCQTCTNVCPVVANYENPAQVLGLLPHQIMHSLGLGLREMALGAGMVWDCVTCYLCQEHCPQGVQVTDVLYELKNASAAHVKEREEALPADSEAQGPPSGREDKTRS